MSNAFTRDSVLFFLPQNPHLQRKSDASHNFFEILVKKSPF